ncbi:lysozyme [Mongoliitalea daihaiensis]|nr:lysozyme [Mongoliitalea daihaiensis]
MRTNNAGIQLLHHFENCRLTAYLCPARVWTIGWGNTRYEDGTPVRQGDTITQQRADQLFSNILRTFEQGVARLVRAQLNSNQFSALVSFAYNVGLGGFQRSQLLKRVNANPSDPAIRQKFLNWTKAGGIRSNGLIRRRNAEADLYFNPVIR